MIQKHSGFLSSLEAKVWSERGLDRRSPAKEWKGRMQGKSTKAVGEAESILIYGFTNSNTPNQSGNRSQVTVAMFTCLGNSGDRGIKEGTAEH